MDQDKRNPKYLTKNKEEAIGEKSFSPMEVTNLVAKARLMMRKEVDKRAEAEGGWRVVDGEEARRKDREVARELLGKELAADARGEICWQCNERGHTSKRCPLEVLCFYCRKIDHERWNFSELRRKMGSATKFHDRSGMGQGGVRIISGEGSSSRWEVTKDKGKAVEQDCKGSKMTVMEKEGDAVKAKETREEETKERRGVLTDGGR